MISSPFDTVNTTLRIKSAQFIDPVVERDIVVLSQGTAVLG